MHFRIFVKQVFIKIYEMVSSACLFAVRKDRIQFNSGV